MFTVIINESIDYYNKNIKKEIKYQNKSNKIVKLQSIKKIRKSWSESHSMW